MQYPSSRGATRRAQALLLRVAAGLSGSGAFLLHVSGSRPVGAPMPCRRTGARRRQEPSAPAAKKGQE